MCTSLLDLILIITFELLFQLLFLQCVAHCEAIVLQAILRLNLRFVLLVLCLILATTRRAVVALPYAVSVSWALIGVLAELSDSGRASACPAWEAIGEEKQATLQTVAGVSLAVCAVLAVLSAIAFARQESGAARERSTLASGPARICKAEYGRAET